MDKVVDSTINEFIESESCLFCSEAPYLVARDQVYCQKKDKNVPMFKRCSGFKPSKEVVNGKS